MHLVQSISMSFTAFMLSARISLSLTCRPTLREAFLANQSWIARDANVQKAKGFSSALGLFPSQQSRHDVTSTRLRWIDLYSPNVKRHKTTSHIKMSTQDQSPDLYQPTFEKGDKVQVEVISFGPLGASVDVIAHNSHDPSDCIATDEPALGRGLILQREINYFREKRGGVDIVKYETLPAYVERVREEQFDENGGIEVRLDISLRPIGGLAKALELGDQIMEKLKEENGVLNIGDKSSPEEINQYFPGGSKKAFKKAVSNLYKQGLVKPGPDSISLMK
ncbi:hypothetical protein HJC23_014108 [Cyclotella cryptica]|uniref:Conserved virulence factor B-like winged helix domain-containing protein n=1 Tax=Cyclotella cryptica TaxID=29204 RepID=A0ABD3QT71_9STRA|eukprot:CCRYP_002513-RA/>CCRYP_002513-RA protein AED:0.14 eAED:-0.18 QI:0/-1/0/1/-1/1/1/0/278